MSDKQFGMGGGGDSPFGGNKIVNPEVILKDKWRKFMAFLSTFQIAVFSKVTALNKFYADPETDVCQAFIDESIDLSVNNEGWNVEQYIEAAKVRVSVEDRKRIYQKDENTM